MAKNIVNVLDHTLLRPDATFQDISKLCQEAAAYKFYSVCVNPVFVTFAKDILSGTDIKTCTVVGFPLGANVPEIKLREAVKAAADGAHEIDMVANIGCMKSQDFLTVEKEIAEIRKNLPFNVLLKVIVEASLLSDTELTEAAKVVISSGAQFIKTSTGFFGGATVDMVKKIKSVVDENIEIKASGGIKKYQSAVDVINAGASRLGCSASVEIAKAAVNHNVT